ncbi:hypothetical protein BJ878DRAFT_479660 [Calycina marina]|uniref:Uncharacterized protein n=1 Tax=Calycina marina TaxID=1763456 RepID=A0A9P8CFR3_9HELO|nr:hypothetical protein BJ878DRAFT_479660 [Calycina marina]
MGFSRSRTMTISIAAFLLSYSILSLLLLSQLPDERFHFAQLFGWYLHFASMLSVFGAIGALRHHSLSICLFSHFLALDTILTTAPRILLPLLLLKTSTLCAAPPSIALPLSRHSPQQLRISTHHSAHHGSISSFAKASRLQMQIESVAASWTIEGCERIVTLVRGGIVLVVVGIAILQVLGASKVRSYARRLGRRGTERQGEVEMREEGVLKV